MGRSAARSDGELKPLIRKALRSVRETFPLNSDVGLGDPGGLIRISSFAGLCAREEVLCSAGRLNLIRRETIEPDVGTYFEHGNGLHWVLQNRILPDTGTIRGRWRCGNCGTHHGGFEAWLVDADGPKKDKEALHRAQATRPETCPTCNAPLTSVSSYYAEQLLVDPKLRLSGHPDGFLWIESLPGLGLLEIKSINPKGAWEVRGCPKLDHVVQAQCYMWLTGCRWAKLLYWDKAGQGMSAFIEHLIEYDEDHVDAIRNLVHEIWDGVRGEMLPERICESSVCARAKLCSVTKPCFEEVR
jgi:hypothetical protein